MDTIRSAATSWKLAKGTIFHSDRGSQYTSVAVRDLLRKLGFRQSFSRTGKPGDNTWSESFYSILKKELVHPIGRFQSREEAAQGVFTFINSFYNTTRIQKRLDYLSPLKWLNRYYSTSLRTSAYLTVRKRVDEPSISGTEEGADICFFFSDFVMVEGADFCFCFFFSYTLSACTFTTGASRISKARKKAVNTVIFFIVISFL